MWHPVSTLSRKVMSVLSIIIFSYKSSYLWIGHGIVSKLLKTWTIYGTRTSETIIMMSVGRSILGLPQRHNGPLTRFAKLRVAHAPGMPRMFSPPPRVSNSNMHHGTCVTHVPRCIPGSLTSVSLWRRRRGKCSRCSRRMRNPQFCVSGKRSIVRLLKSTPIWPPPKRPYRDCMICMKNTTSTKLFLPTQNLLY